MEGKKNKKNRMSLQLFLTISILLICVIILSVYSYASMSVHSEIREKETNKTLRQQNVILAEEYVKNGYKIYGDKDLSGNVDTIASFYNGRAFFVNDEYKILRDSYGSRQDSFIVSQKIMEVMNGDKAEIIEKSVLKSEYIMPVMDNDDIVGVLVVVSGGDTLNKTKTYVYIIITFVVLCILSVVAAILLATVSVKDLKNINVQIENARDGKMDKLLDVKGFSEYEMLTENYNLTVNRLMVIDSSRQEFVSNVSHELKTPITSMKVLADSLVQNEDATLEMYKEFMSDIVEEVDRENTIINDLLALVRMENNSEKLNAEEKNINELLLLIVKRVKPIALARGIEITYESYKDVIAEVDETKLTSALSNIIENAIKYNVDNGWIKVTLNADNKYFHVKVADSGVGIPEDCKHRVFDRFFRVDKARSRDTGGTGLGLAITKNIVLMHGGVIKLYSESGQGTTFTIKIPLRQENNQEEDKGKTKSRSKRV